MVHDTERGTPYITRIEVFGATDHSWIEKTVAPTRETGFEFKPVVLQ